MCIDIHDSKSLLLKNENTHLNFPNFSRLLVFPKLVIVAVTYPFVYLFIYFVFAEVFFKYMFVSYCIVLKLFIKSAHAVDITRTKRIGICTLETKNVS